MSEPRNDHERAAAGQPLWKPEPRATVKDEKRRKTNRTRRDVYLLVEKRDGLKCRCCGKPLVRTLEMRLDKLEHHHVYGRQIKNAESTWNLACVCRECHDTRHAKRTLKIAGNPDTHLVMEQDGKQWTTVPVRPLPLSQRSER